MKSLPWTTWGYDVELTGDGSPTLRLLPASLVPSGEVKDQFPRPESMHHSGGAAAETQYIYGKSMTEILNKKLTPQILVVGLGLGYIEALMVDLFLKIREDQLRTNDIQNLRMVSFEADPVLVENFSRYVKSENLSPEISAVYDQVFASIIGVDRSLKVKHQLKLFLQNGQWEIKNKLELPFQDLGKFNVLQYDAFSSKTNQELWDENFLRAFFDHFAGPTCAFSTYACKKSLKNILIEKGFTLDVREGFQGKRNCTFAFRERAL